MKLPTCRTRRCSRTRVGSRRRWQTRTRRHLKLVPSFIYARKLTDTRLSIVGQSVPVEALAPSPAVVVDAVMLAAGLLVVAGVIS